MAKVKFPLEVANGVMARTIEELKENFDIEKIVGYFLEGKLYNWLCDRYYEDEAEEVEKLSGEDVELPKKLCEIFGIKYDDESVLDAEEIARKNERITKLKQFTDDEEVIKNIDSVAFDQEELAELYDREIEKIYLCEGSFNIPKSKQNLEYIELGGAQVKGKKNEMEKSDEGLKDVIDIIRKMVEEAENENSLDYSEEACDVLGELPAEVIDIINNEAYTQNKALNGSFFENNASKLKKIAKKWKERTALEY